MRPRGPGKPPCGRAARRRDRGACASSAPARPKTRRVAIAIGTVAGVWVLASLGNGPLITPGAGRWAGRCTSSVSSGSCFFGLALSPSRPGRRASNFPLKAFSSATASPRANFRFQRTTDEASDARQQYQTRQEIARLPSGTTERCQCDGRDSLVGSSVAASPNVSSSCDCDILVASLSRADFRCAPLRLAPSKFAPQSRAPSRCAPARSAPSKCATLNEVHSRCAPRRFAHSKCTQLRLAS